MDGGLEPTAYNGSCSRDCRKARAPDGAYYLQRLTLSKSTAPGSVIGDPTDDSVSVC